MTNKKPIKKFKSSAVEGAIWRNQKNGDTRYCIDLSKNYKAETGYKTTKVFWPGDLGHVSKIAIHTAKWITSELAQEQLHKEENSHFEMLDSESDFDVV